MNKRSNNDDEFSRTKIEMELNSFDLGAGERGTIPKNFSIIFQKSRKVQESLFYQFVFSTELKNYLI